MRSERQPPQLKAYHNSPRGIREYGIVRCCYTGGPVELYIAIYDGDNGERDLLNASNIRCLLGDYEDSRSTGEYQTKLRTAQPILQQAVDAARENPQILTLYPFMNLHHTHAAIESGQFTNADQAITVKHFGKGWRLTIAVGAKLARERELWRAAQIARPYMVPRPV